MVSESDHTDIYLACIRCRFHILPQHFDENKHRAVFHERSHGAGGEDGIFIGTHGCELVVCTDVNVKHSPISN